MTFVFGDIHGCLSSFNALLEFLDPGKDDVVVTLGDYIDRGPASRGVVERLIQLQSEINLVALKGNHEFMMEDARKGPPASSFWRLNGGIETLESYRTRTLLEVPESHWDFFQKLKPYHCIDNFLLTHATPTADKAPEDWDTEDLYWRRFRDLEERPDGRILVCGHTPQSNRLPKFEKKHLCLDTGCVHGGYLTALTLETGDYLQANEEEDYRDGKIDWEETA